MLDTPLLMLGIHEHTGHFPRSMADDFHFGVPLWRDVLRRFGAVPGSRDACRAIMRDAHSLLVFPGGGREVFKRRNEAYKLIWGGRPLPAHRMTVLDSWTPPQGPTRKIWMSKILDNGLFHGLVLIGCPHSRRAHLARGGPTFLQARQRCWPWPPPEERSFGWTRPQHQQK